MKKVPAFTSGTIEHQTEKSIKMMGWWYPKSAIQILKSKEGLDVIVFKQWFVNKNRHLAYTELGEMRTKSTQLQDGTILYQGKAHLVPSYKEQKRRTDEELDELFDKLVSQGMSEREASKKVRKMVYK